MQPLTRLQQFWLAAFLAAWCFVGLTGRDAWKPEEALALAPLLDWLDSGAWLPAASPFPLHTLFAGLTAWLTQPWLDLQDGARLASGVFTLAALVLTGLAARTLFGPGYGAAAALALMGGFGLMLRAHALLPETALLAGYALLMYGIAVARTRAGTGAGAMATAIFLLVLGRGLPDLVAAVLIMVLPMLSRAWRERPYRQAVALALAGLAAGLAAWLAALAFQGGLAAWWQGFLAFSVPAKSPLWLLDMLSWFAWPIWPLALWTLWHEHRRLARVPDLHPALAGVAVTLLLGLWPSHASGAALLPILVPLALLAAHGVANLKRGAAQAFYWFGVLCFLFFAFAFWLYYAAAETGWPAGAARQMARLAGGYQGGQIDTRLLAAALAGTLLWLIAIPLFPRAKARPILVWATGMGLTWLLMIVLFKPWGEAGWGYRPQIAAMTAHLPENACLRADVDPAMTAMLRLRLPDRYRAGGDCDWWLVAGEREDFAARQWPVMTAWTGFRPRDKSRYYALVRRDAP